jgi:hypothetical protein
LTTAEREGRSIRERRSAGAVSATADVPADRTAATDYKWAADESSRQPQHAATPPPSTPRPSTYTQDGPKP